MDYVITTRELGAMFRMKKVNMASLKPEQYDNPIGIGSSAAVLFGNTGGRGGKGRWLCWCLEGGKEGGGGTRLSLNPPLLSCHAVPCCAVQAA